MKSSFTISTIFGLILAAICVLLSCTSSPEERLPAEKVMHFPLQMTIKDKTLVVGASSVDGKYDFGRMISLNTAKIKKEAAKSKNIVWDQVVGSNLLIKPDSRFLYVGHNLVVLSKKDNDLFVIPSPTNKPICDGAFLKINECQKALNIKLSALDPYGLVNLSNDILLVSYLSSDRLDVLKINQTIEPVKNLDGYGLLKKVIKKSLPTNQSIISRQVYITNKDDAALSKTHILWERHAQQRSNLAKPKATYLMSIPTNLLISKNDIPAANVKVLDLQEKFFISSAQDFFIDEVSNIAYVLASKPALIYKIDLHTGDLVETHSICMGATSLSVSTALDRMYVPCFKEDKIVSLSLSTLKTINISEHVGRGPAWVIIDEKNKLIYSTFFIDGTLMIFDYNLKHLAQIFDKAPPSRIGS